MQKPRIEAIDNFFPEDISDWVSEYVHNAHYTYGETDDSSLDPRPPTGVVHDIFNVENEGEDKFTHKNEDAKLMWECFHKGISVKYPKLFDDYMCYRLYINCFAPRELANFHQDCCENSDQITFLFYPKHMLREYDIAQGGWTEFYVDRKTIGVPPYFNSLVKFDANLLHRATPFKSYHRFTVAFKVVSKKEYEADD